MPASNFIEGKYTTVQDQKYVDWLCGTGYPEAECKKMLGTHWSFTIKKVPEGYFGTWACDEFPEYGGADLFLIGVYQELDSVFLGGKGKCLFTLTKDNHFEVEAETENLGRLTWTEDYCAEGYKMVMTRDGKTVEQFWKRAAAEESIGMVEGSYSCVRTKEMADWMQSHGLPAEEAKKHVGTHWTCTCKKVDDKYITSFACKELPSYNGCETFLIGKEQEIDSPMFGGKAKLMFVETSLNHFNSTAVTENMGTLKWTEDYNMDGLIVNYLGEDGKNVKEVWERQESMEGWYKFSRAENVAEFMKATDADPGFEKGLEMMTHCFQRDGDGWLLTERVAGYEAKNRFKLDEEYDYVFPAFPKVNARILTTRVNGRTFKLHVKKNDNGKLEEWTYKVCPAGAMWIGVDKASGVTVKIFLKKFHNFYGEYKLVSEAGTVDLWTAHGLSRDLANALVEEKDVKFELKDLGDGNNRYQLFSKLQPMTFTYKLGEEYEMESPALPGVMFKCLTTMCGDTVISVSKSPMGTNRMSLKLGETFCVAESSFVGCDLVARSIFEKI